MQPIIHGHRQCLRQRCLGLLAAMCFIAFTAVKAVAGQPAAAPIPVERFFQSPAVLGAKLSPSGQKLAITTSKGGHRVGLVVVDLNAAAKATRVAVFQDVDIVAFDWSSDNRLVFSVADLEAGSGEDERWAPGLFAVDADGSNFLPLVRRRWAPVVGELDRHARAHELDWNHKLLAVPLPQEGVSADEVVIGRLNFGADELLSITPMWLNVRTLRTRSFEVDAPAGALDWMFDSKGQARLVRTRGEGKSAVYWRGPSSTTWQKLSESNGLYEPFSPAAVDDAGNLYLHVSEGPEGHAVFTRYDFEKGAPRMPPLVTAPGFDLSGDVVQGRAGGPAMGVRFNNDEDQTVWFDDAMKRMQALADAALPGRVNRLSCRRCGTDSMVAVVHSYADRDPGRLVLYEAATQRWRLIAEVLDGIDPARMATVEIQRIKARDGHDIPVWLTKPAGSVPGQALPTVVLVHGGPWVRGGHWQWEPMEQFLASRGYLVISPEFRGSTGYGDAHYKAGWKQWGQAMQDDVADALLWAQKEGLASNKACIAGASYGGYSTLMGLVRHPQLYRCGAAWVAVTDPTLYLDGAWWVNDDISASGRRYVLPELVGDVTKDAAMLNANSPVAQAKRIQAPLLLAFGEADRRVPLAHGERLRAAMREAGNPPEWVSYPNEGHSWRQVSNHIDFAQRLEKFLGKHLKAEGP